MALLVHTLGDSRAGLGKLSQTIILKGIFPVVCCIGHDSNPKVLQLFQKVPSVGLSTTQINVDGSQSTAAHTHTLNHTSLSNNLHLLSPKFYIFLQNIYHYVIYYLLYT